MVDSAGQRYFYHHSSTSKSGETSVYWRCVDTRGCLASAHVINDVIVNKVEHTRHQTFQARQLAKDYDDSLVMKSQDFTQSEILKELEMLPPEVQNCLSCKTKIMNRIDQESKIRGQKEGKINGLVRLGAEMEAWNEEIYIYYKTTSIQSIQLCSYSDESQVKSSK